MTPASRIRAVQQHLNQALYWLRTNERKNALWSMGLAARELARAIGEASS